MSEDIENHTIRLLQEMRAEMCAGFDKVDARFSELDARFDEVDLKIDGNTILLNMVAGVADHERRIGAIEKHSS